MRDWVLFSIMQKTVQDRQARNNARELKRVQFIKTPAFPTTEFEILV